MIASELAAAILRGYPGPPTLIAGVRADGFASRLVRALRDERAEDVLLDWIEDTCTRYAIDARSIEMLAAACDQAAGLIASAGARERLRALEAAIGLTLSRCSTGGAAESNAEEDTIDGTIAAFLMRLDEADPMTGEHSRAVSLWCRRLAARLALTADVCRFAGRCGMLHDVGKARTPPAILHAPRSLTDSEWLTMRDHTVAGAVMLAEIESLHQFEFAARSHHERLDGKGYPDQLTAAAISPMVRIVSVADSFNAMIGRRPYRAPLSPANALEQLVRNCETQFDPDVVTAMIDIVERPTATSDTVAAIGLAPQSTPASRAVPVPIAARA